MVGWCQCAVRVMEQFPHEGTNWKTTTSFTKVALKVEDWPKQLQKTGKVFSKAPWRMAKRESQFWDSRNLKVEICPRPKMMRKKRWSKDKLLGIYKQYINCAKSGIFMVKSEEEKTTKLLMLMVGWHFDIPQSLNLPIHKTLEAIKMPSNWWCQQWIHHFWPCCQHCSLPVQKQWHAQNDVVDLYTKLNDCADYNINNNEAFIPITIHRPKKTWMAPLVAKIEDEIFDYTFFKDKFQPEYKVTWQSGSDEKIIQNWRKNSVRRLRSSWCR